MPTQLFDCAPCCGGQGCTCPAFVAVYQFTLAGIVAGTGGPGVVPCTNCAGWNTTWTLTFQGGLGFPAWLGGNSPCRDGSLINLAIFLRQLGSGPGSIFQLGLPQDFNNFHVVFYSVPCEQWNCLGANTLTLQDNGAENLRCQGWPATITVTPA